MSDREHDPDGRRVLANVCNANSGELGEVAPFGVTHRLYIINCRCGSIYDSAWYHY